MQTVINSKVDRDGLGKLAFEDAVEAAKLGTTIIVGGYLNTDYIKVRRIDSDGAKIGGFTIDKGRLVWKAGDYFGGLSRSLKLGYSDSSKEGVVHVTFNPATDGNYGVSAIGAGIGGSAAIYGSSHLSNPRYPDNYIYAGFFDGNVRVLGDVSAEGFFPSDGNGNYWSVVSDGYFAAFGESKAISIHVVKGLIVEMKY